MYGYDPDPARPSVTPADWASANNRVVSFAAFFAVASVAAAFLAHSLAGLAAVTADTDPAAQAGMALGGMIISLLALGSMLGLLISWLFWWRSAQRLSAAHGAPGHGHLGYWGSGAFAVLLAASYPVPSGFADASAGLVVQAGLRVAGAAALVAGVLHTRGWLRDRGPGTAVATYSLTTGGEPASPVAATPTADDWNAAVWDPAVQEEIERRRRPR